MNLKKIIVLALFMGVCGTAALATTNSEKQDSLKYRIYLTDKKATPYSLQHPEAFLSKKALDRRQRQHLSVDSTDIPVCRDYIKAIQKTGVKIVAVGKWNNFVTVSCNNPNKVDKIMKLKFVRSTKLVWEKPKQTADRKTTRETITSKVMKKGENKYGPAYDQIHQCNGDRLHQYGFTGKGMTIAIIDAGFHNADSIPEMKNIHILGTHDFVSSGTDIYAQGTHGMCVLSIMGMNQPYYMMGSAPDASYWLLRSEDEESETLVEQDYWSEAIEFADSVGVDAVNSSLGYYNFDDSTMNYRYRDLDGKTALISREATMAAQKGIMVVVSAGNAGSGSWKKISVPGDADEVLTIGAVSTKGVLASFSSVGNTADGRIKPDVVATGSRTSFVNAHGDLSVGNGTSFSSPLMCGLVTCLRQACPNASVKEIIEAIHRSGDRSDYPDNIYGYGIPNMLIALSILQPEHSFK